MLHPCNSKSRIKKLKEKEKENRNDLDVLSSHDTKVEYFKCSKEGHKCRECLFRKTEKERKAVRVAAHMAIPQKAQ